MEELKNTAVKIVITCDLSNKSKRQVRSFLVKYNESIIDDLEEANEERATFLFKINKVKNNAKESKKHDETTTKTDKKSPSH